MKLKNNDMLLKRYYYIICITQMRRDFDIVLEILYTFDIIGIVILFRMIIILSLT